MSDSQSSDPDPSPRPEHEITVDITIAAMQDLGYGQWLASILLCELAVRHWTLWYGGLFLLHFLLWIRHRTRLEYLSRIMSTSRPDGSRDSKMSAAVVIWGRARRVSWIGPVWPLVIGVIHNQFNESWRYVILALLFVLYCGLATLSGRFLRKHLLELLAAGRSEE